MLKFVHEDTFNLSPFAKWNLSLSLNALLGGDSVWDPTPHQALRPPCPAGHPSLALLLQLDMPQGHCLIQQSRTWPPEAGRNQNPLHTELVSTNLSQLAGLKERSWTPKAPKKKFMLMGVPAWSNFCLHSNLFTSSCQQIITAMKVLKVFLGYPVQNIFFEVAVRLQQLPTKNMKWEVKSFDLARARHTSQAGARSSPRGLFYQKKLISV